MAKAKIQVTPEAFVVFCPACNTTHAFPRKNHSFNESEEKPTLFPGLRLASRYTPPPEARPADMDPGDYARAVKAHGERHSEADPNQTICHIIVNNGELQYLGDCTHKMVCETIGLPAKLDRLPWRPDELEAMEAETTEEAEVHADPPASPALAEAPPPEGEPVNADPQPATNKPPPANQGSNGRGSRSSR